MAQEEEKEMKEQENEEEDSEEEAREQTIELPPVNFENFIFELYNTALMHLGFRDPETGNLIQTLPFARHTIDTLGMIQEKTKGNLTAPESNLLENLLYQLRMDYLRAVKQAQDESKKVPATEGEEKTEEVTEDTETEGKGDTEVGG